MSGATVTIMVIDDSIVLARGRIDGEGDETALLLDELVTAQAAIDSEVHTLVLKLEGKTTEPEVLDRILEAVAKHPGEQRLQIHVREGEHTFRIQADGRHSLRLTDELLDDMAELLGPENLAFTRR